MVHEMDERDGQYTTAAAELPCSTDRTENVACNLYADTAVMSTPPENTTEDFSSLDFKNSSEGKAYSIPNPSSSATLNNNKVSSGNNKGSTVAELKRVNCSDTHPLTATCPTTSKITKNNKMNFQTQENQSVHQLTNKHISEFLLYKRHAPVAAPRTSGVHEDKRPLTIQECIPTSISRAERPPLPASRKIFNKGGPSPFDSILETSTAETPVEQKISRKTSQSRRVENKRPVPAPRRSTKSTLPNFSDARSAAPSDLQTECCSPCSISYSTETSESAETLRPASGGSDCSGARTGATKSMLRPYKHISDDESYVRLADSELYVLFRDSILNSTPTKEEPLTTANTGLAEMKPKPSSSEAVINSVPLANETPAVSILRAPNGQNFFIDHRNHRTTWTDPLRGSTKLSPVEENLGALPEGWEERQHFDGRLLFINHKTRTAQWQDPRLAHGQVNKDPVPYTRDTKHKYKVFKLSIPKPPTVPENFEIKVLRASILEDSYKIISSVSDADVLRSTLCIVIEDESSVLRTSEWFSLLSKHIFSPAYDLFEYTSQDAETLEINSNSGLSNEDHLSYFNCAGRIAGMAVYHGNLLDAHFVRPFYKIMLQRPLVLSDIKSVDTLYFYSLLWIEENDPQHLRKTFSIDEYSLGLRTTHELKPGGENIFVTGANKSEYIRLVIEWRLMNRVKKQMYAFLEGFASIIPLHLLQIFDTYELELLMCGIQTIDVDDWCKHTGYKGEYHSSHIVIQWFWRAVLSFSNELRARLLQFTTGTSRVPLNGFQDLPIMFTIESRDDPKKQPKAQTSFHRLYLPCYESYAQLKEKLTHALGSVE